MASQINAFDVVCRSTMSLLQASLDAFEIANHRTNSFLLAGFSWVVDII
jgi:hypothetical protein